MSSRSPSGLTTYRFDNVLVADTQFFAQLEPQQRQPQILVLNSRLNRCADQFRKRKVCTTCCLQVERPEFRRRSGAPTEENDKSADCFANCSERRKVNIELNAQAKLSGKLVILALTRTDRLSHEYPFGGQNKSLNCHTKRLLAFQRFEPSQNDADKSLAKTYYSRLSAEQLPSFMIDSLAITWQDDPSGTPTNDQQLKEFIRMEVESSKSSGKSRQQRKVLVDKETLLINELSCRFKTLEGNSSFSGPFEVGVEIDEEQPEEATPPIKIHVLTLINRDKSAVEQVKTQSVLPAIRVSNETAKLETYHAGPKAYTAVPKEVPAMSPKTTEIPSESFIDFPRAAQVQQIKRLTPAADRAPDRIQRLASSSWPRNVSQTDVTMPTTPKTLLNNGVRRLAADRSTGIDSQRARDWYSLNSTTLLLGQSYLTDLGGAFRTRLKSNSFLIFTLASSLIILVYTLGLLIYLKKRNRRPSPESSGAKAHPQSAASSASNISQPYNLRMQSATRGRLELMLGLTGDECNSREQRGEKQAKQLHNSVSPIIVANTSEPNLAGDTQTSNLAPTRAIRSPRSQRISWAPHLEAPEASRRLDLGFGERQNSKFTVERNGITSNNSYPSQYVHQMSTQNSFNLAHGTVQVVRAIRQAATNAKSKLRSPRYRSNLNVIPESDLEHLQLSSRDSDLELLDNLMIQQQQQQRGTDGASSIRASRLVQDALSRECSHRVQHYAVSAQRNFSNRQHCRQILTLFSRPSKRKRPEQGEHVSRSRILNQVKSDDPYEVHLS